MNKLYDRIDWNNNTTPALNESNLNSMSKAIDDIDDRVIEIGADIYEKVPIIEQTLEEVEELSQNPPYIGTNGNWYIWDTSTGQYIDSGIDASITVSIADVTMLAPDATPYVTNTGTDTDPIFHLFIPRGQAGQNGQDGTDGVSPAVTITTITGGHRVNITDKDHPSGQNFDVMDGEGASDWDDITNKPNFATVATSGSYNDLSNKPTIPDISTKADKVSSATSGNFAGLDASGNLTDSGNKASDFKAANAHDSWSDVTNKPFNTVGTGLNVSSNSLRLNTAQNIMYDAEAYNYDGSSSDAGQVGFRVRTLNTQGQVPSSPVFVNVPIAYQMLQYANLTSYSFTNSVIDTDSMIDVYTDTYGDNPSDVTINNHTCTVTFSTQKTRQVAIVITNFAHQA